MTLAGLLLLGAAIACGFVSVFQENYTLLALGCACALAGGDLLDVPSRLRQVFCRHSSATYGYTVRCCACGKALT